MHCFKPSSRRGVTLTELVVAAGLLVTAMTIVAPLAVRSGRVWQDSRHHQLALDELSNHLDRIISLESDQRELAITELQLSEFIRATLPDATLAAEKRQDENGSRLILSINWNRRVKSVPLTLVGWLDPLPGLSEKEEPTP